MTKKQLESGNAITRCIKEAGRDVRNAWRGLKIALVDPNAPFRLIATKAKGSETVLSGGRYWI